MLQSTILALLSASSALGSAWIAPGAVWYDTSDNVIDAHGGGLFKEGDTYYWTGHAAPVPEDPTWANVTLMVYSSRDLVNWDFVGRPAQATSGLWRPKMAKPNCHYWVYGQQDRYSLSLSSDSAAGPYTERDRTRLPPRAYSYSDTGMFHDEASDTWFLLTSADSNTVQINRIMRNGTVGEEVSNLRNGPLEAPGIFTDSGIYYLILSAKTGYRHNPNKAYWATSLAGPWQGGSDIAPPETKTYNSQNTFDFTIKGSERTTHVYMGDDWVSGGWGGSTYVWLPMTADAETKTVTLQFHDMWRVDPRTGELSFPTTRERYESEHATLSKASGVAEVTFSEIEGTGSRQWIRLLYSTADPQTAKVYVKLNNGSNIDTLTLNTRAGLGISTPVQLVLQPGSENTVTLGVFGQDSIVQVEGLEILEDDFDV
ncbi:Arabinanase/levansucrase/invertase [Plectosphaerella plurivora]|uniref:Arabinanase/levansucrase/invertase n=1 Tax=Plectosphaerella plurivora TaxID=936078 RepID=A0A9P8V6A6_9PEZI|nr:Arabinanase/levansucrase/invertase [Plectosphaerella plurivora]